MKRFVSSFAVAALLSSPASAQKLGKAEKEAIARSPSEAAAFVAVTDDPLDTSITLSTEPFYQLRQGLLKVVNSDKFLRAWVNKKTGEARFQVYVYVNYGGNGWQFFNRASYETASGPENADVTRIASDVTGCSRYGCGHREDFGFNIPEAVLRWAARDAAAGVDASWKFRLYSQAGMAETTGVLKTEIAGLLMRVDDERNRIAPAR